MQPDHVSENPLQQVPGVTDEIRARLASRWITTAEQVYSIAATPDGRASLGQMLGSKAVELESFLAAVAQAIGEQRCKEILASAQNPLHSLGALLPEKPRQDAAKDNPSQ